MREPAGLLAQVGPGVTVTLSDASADVTSSSSVDPKLLIVHQQDIQAVVNAMWKAGAQAITIQGQRVVSTTGIRCIGNSVQLQGVPYSQPYVISAVGDPAALTAEIARDPYLQVYREDAADPEIAVGWDEQVEDKITAPAYDGLRRHVLRPRAPLGRQQSLELTRARTPSEGRLGRRSRRRRRTRSVGWRYSVLGDVGEVDGELGPDDTTMVTCAALRRRLAGTRDLLDHLSLRRIGARRRHRDRHEARVAQRLLRICLLHAHDVGDLLRALRHEDVDRRALRHLGVRGGVGPDDGALRLVGLRLVEHRIEMGVL